METLDDGVEHTQSCPLEGIRKVEYLITNPCPSLVGGIHSDTCSLSCTQPKHAHEAKQRL